MVGSFKIIFSSSCSLASLLMVSGWILPYPPDCMMNRHRLFLSLMLRL
jgi:hypothetical protein